MDQRTNDWLEWRNKGIGASDAPIILGVSPWSTLYSLWQIKTGKVKSFEGNWATDRGNRLEPAARAVFETLVDIEMPPSLAEHPEHKWMRASLDGLSLDGTKALEIKCPGLTDHNKAVSGQVPEKYYPQLQHQLAVTGADMVYYFSYSPDHDDSRVPKWAVIEVPRDEAYIKTLIEKEQAFWSLVESNTPPALDETDSLVITDSDAVGVFKAVAAIKAQLEQIEERYQSAVSALSKYTSLHPKVECAGVKVKTSWRKNAKEPTITVTVKGEVNDDLSMREVRTGV